MAELVHNNMEQMLPFFNELDTLVNKDYAKTVVSKREHFEYKIASKKRNFDDFQNYIMYEMSNYSYIKKLKLTDANSLLKNIVKLIERILKQVTIHFQSEPRAFLLGVEIGQKFRFSDLEKTHWEALLKKHGNKNVKYYISAAHRAMHVMLQRDESYTKYKSDSEVQKLKSLLHRLQYNRTKCDLVKKDIKELTEKDAELQTELRYRYCEWTRNIFTGAFKEFPKNKLLYKNFLAFEINNYRDQQFATDEREKIYGECKDGRVLVILLDQILEDLGDDSTFLVEVVAVVDEHIPSLSCQSLDRMRLVLATLPAVTVQSTPEPMCVDEPLAAIDPCERFLAKYPDPKYVRAVSPKTATNDLLEYVRALTTKIVSGELSRVTEMPRLRLLLDWVLSDDDWSRVSLDLWWQYYETERCCGNLIAAEDVLLRADSKLTGDHRTMLTVRKLKADLAL